MKKILYLACLTLCLSVVEKTSVYAQTPQSSQDGGFIGPPRDTIDYGEPEKIILTNFPNIPYLSISQRAVIEYVLIKEQKITDPQKQKKQQLIEKVNESSINENEKSKIQKNIKKVEGEILHQAKKSNKKIKKQLMKEQYLVFIKKRDEFQFQ